MTQRHENRADRRRMDKRDRALAEQQSKDEATGKWTEWEELTEVNNGQLGGLVPVSRTGFERCYMNNRYLVLVRRPKDDPIMGRCIHLSIRRTDRGAARDWRDMQRIKNELVGPEVEAVELYPAESRLVDAANQYHLWCFPAFRFTFGFNQRDVQGPETARYGATQRAFDR
jgi:hypothetical protein